MNEIKFAMGAIPSPYDIRDYKGTVCTAAADNDLPECYVEPSLPEIRNQGSVGSCVAHSCTSCVESFNLEQEGESARFSPCYTYGNRVDSSYKGQGMVVRDALQTLVKYGAAKWADFPYNIEVPEAINKFNDNLLKLLPLAYPHRISSYYRLNDTAAIKAAIFAGDRVVFVIPWYKDIKVVDGVLTTSQTSDKDGYHCMMLVGWNKDGFILQNSWGATWGNEGRAVLPYNIAITECWGLHDDISDTVKDKIIANAEKRIENMSARITDLETRVNESRKELREALDKLADNVDAEKIAEQEKYIKYLEQTIADETIERTELLGQIDEQKKRIETLNQEILDIKQTTMNETLAKAVNVVINAIKKLFSK